MSGETPKKSFNRWKELQSRLGLLGELFLFMRERKLYWIAPLVIILLLLSLFILAGQSALGPFIYAVF